MTAAHDSRTLASIYDSTIEWTTGPLLADDAESYTAPEADAATARIAAGLARLGVGPSTRVAFAVAGSSRHALAFFACQRLGAVPCALHLREPAARLVESIRWLDAAVVIADSDQEPRVHDALDGERDAPKVVGVGDHPDPRSATCLGELLARDAAPPDHVAGADDLAVILLSSGTTGKPKGTLNLQSTLHATAVAGPAVFGDIGDGDSVLVAVAPSAAAWIHVVMPFFAARATLHFVRRFEARPYVDTLIGERISHAALVPTMWRRVLATVRPEDDLSHVRSVFFAGEVGSDTLISALKEKLPNAQVRTGYLSAEGGCASACVAREDTLVGAGKAASTGRPVRGAHLRIVATDGDPDALLPRGETGEILVRSASVAPGYWKADEQTAARFADGWWRSGDLGCLDASGDLFIQGRTDHVINSGGLKVHAEEVEAALMRHPDVQMAGVVAEPDPDWGQAIVAHVVVTRLGVTAEEIIAFCRADDSIAAYKLPKRIHFHDELPMGPTGKLYRRALSSPG
jgi:acyl-CoA synthetase (AMP-forming)/AMP-acid ligase II